MTVQYAPYLLVKVCKSFVL